METVIWIAQIVLAGMFMFAGLLKLTQPKEKLIDSGQAWVEDFEPTQIRGIAVLELLAAIGLILPAALDIVPVLTPIAASGLVLLMLGASATHVRRGELNILPINLVLLALALFVAIERFGPHSL
jgi:uncharacterized membrane protein YphA (DoxX/SURF4 family)